MIVVYVAVAVRKRPRHDRAINDALSGGVLSRTHMESVATSPGVRSPDDIRERHQADQCCALYGKVT